MTVAEKITYTATAEQIKRMHAAFDEALDDAQGQLGRDYPMIIGGRERTAGATFEVRSPIDRSLLVGTFQRGTAADVSDAVAAARAAFPAWSQRPFEERVET